MPGVGSYGEKGESPFALGNSQKSVLERMRLSQKMAEQRENKLKTFIDGRRDLNVEGLEPVVSQSFLKRKGQLSAHLHSLLRDSSSRHFMPPLDIEAADVNIGLLPAEVQSLNKAVPSTTKYR